MIENQVGDAVAQAERIRAEALDAISAAASTSQLEQVRVQYLGKKAAVNQLMQAMGQLDPGERKELGAAVNGVKAAIASALAEREKALHRAEVERRLEAERLDVTLPGTPYPRGYAHPLLHDVRELLQILSEMGYTIYEGPEVEWERYNFDMLNTPKHHPSRDLQDTFWVTDDICLRTQTSPAQIRLMEAHDPPLRAAVPGFCYRNEAEDASHADRFYQIEGLCVDVDISLADLKGTLAAVAARYFGPDRAVRFRPHYFPFTEPSAEIDIQCSICKGAGCSSCDHEGWLELGGCGVVHPNVLRFGGYDPDVWSGFAFGIGPMRYTMMKHGIPDMRLFRENDLRFLRQFD